MSMFVKKRKINSYACFFLSCVYAVFMSGFPHEYFKDRENYIFKVEYSDYFLSQLPLSFKVLFSEPLFVILNDLLSNVLLAPTVIYVYVFFIAYTCSFMVMRYSDNFLMLVLGLLLIVFIPNMWSLQLGAIRQGVAASLIYWGLYLYRSDNLKLYFILFLSGLIHVGGFLVFFVMVIHSLSKHFFPSLKSIWHVLIATVFFVLSVALSTLLSGYAQSKHAGYFENSLNIGGGLFIFYFFMTIMVFFSNKSRVLWSNFETLGFLGVVIYLSIYFISPVSGRLLDFFVLPLLVILVSKFSFRNIVLISFMLVINFFLFFNGGAMNVMNESFW